MKQKSAAATMEDYPVSSELKDYFTFLFKEESFERIVDKALAFIPTLDLSPDDFPLSKVYTRTIIHQEECGPEAMLARWRKDAVSSTHGHPEFGFYYLLSGKLHVETFEFENNTLLSSGETVMRTGQYFLINGRADRFDNGIHRITVLEESLSLHIYSDDALKGICFD